MINMHNIEYVCYFLNYNKYLDEYSIILGIY